ncbi:MAG: patatin-like phospholipase family protein [Pseudomonadota bacterium]
MTSDILYYAGPRALALISEGGLSPDMVDVVAGAAGGPKWLVLGHLDRFLFSRWFQGRQRPLFLLGASIGAWRFAAASRRDPAGALDAFEKAYIYQFYRRRPTPAEVSRESRRIMSAYLGNDGISEILDHPYLRLSFLTVRCRHAGAADSSLLQTAGLAGAVAANLAGRRWLKYFFSRVLFHHPAGVPPCWPLNEFSPRRVPLAPENLKDALLASGSIPLVMAGVRGIAGAPAGTYRDGGAIDYHLDIPHRLPEDRIVLFPHYSARIIPGWLDKPLPWRRPSPATLENMLMVAPSPSFIAGLPHGKIADRKDFYRFAGNDNGRIDTWHAVSAGGRRLAAAFADDVDSGRIRQMVRPFPGLKASETAD